MGLRMDIHSPAAASVPAREPLDKAEGKEALMKLMKRKEALEEDIESLWTVLNSHGVNMTTSLTTFDGFPRDDIDVAQIRTIRSRIIHLRNDHKTLMSLIEEGLHKLHAAHLAIPKDDSSVSRPLPTSASSSTDQISTNSRALPNAVFARVNSVVSNSPADLAGLKPGDGIVQFGQVDFLSQNSFAQVSSTVKNNQDNEISVKILRRAHGAETSETLLLKLVPRSNWGGNGLLGCHLLPM